jgi:hypothetical protein
MQRSSCRWLNTGMKASEFIQEATFGTTPKRPARTSDRPSRGHKAEPTYKNVEISERGKTSREVCTSSRSDKDLGASNLASCKSQGLRARDGKKSHKLGKGPESRVTMGGHKIKGKKYGGKIPDYGSGT